MADAQRLGWWVQLVDCAAVGEDIRSAVVEGWGRELSGSSVCVIDWLEGQPQPTQLMMYGTAEDIPPDFDEMASSVRPLMEYGQYFAFVFMKDTMLAVGGLECVVITKNAAVRVNGRMMISSAIESALHAEGLWIRTLHQNGMPADPSD